MFTEPLRNLDQDLNRVIQDEIKRAGDSYIAAAVALNVVERLQAEDPELLAKFLDQHAVHVVHRRVLDLEGARRLQVKAAAERVKASVFQNAVSRYEAGAQGALTPWLDTVYVVTSGNLRRRLGDMDKEDLEFAAGRYSNRARANEMQAAFLRALANRVGAGTVADVFEEEQITKLWRSLQ
jgi:hypothetical protein